MKLLILGGTSDALKLCKLALAQYEVIYSIKGQVRQPQLNCKIHSGGFGGVAGMVNFLQQQHIHCLLDATHPYAVNISNHAKLAATHCSLPCFHYIRPAWQQQENDHWIFFDTLAQLTALLNRNEDSRARLFFTIGQLTPEFIAQKNPQHYYIVRSAITSNIKRTSRIKWIKKIGPFALEDERTLFERYQINALISKNSGGKSVEAKIQTAREKRLPVYLLKRPNFQSNYPIIFSIIEILLAVNQQCKAHNTIKNFHY
ncbi:MAG TPA: precorrin-6A/cobalt-precorrin-6A reductase [Leucothrix mucor]|uniref:Precorrin-6A/cobalt-precorrin-6A reductase n=1 Tax=Leucothrix mucor TaxID=45248 RepID=A0A7V2SZV5_LEUMU|nr:precorrin-6A/cobalt-precorrin-6A reductase [Leucothrix mucor]